MSQSSDLTLTVGLLTSTDLRTQNTEQSSNGANRRFEDLDLVSEDHSDPLLPRCDLGSGPDGNKLSPVDTQEGHESSGSLESVYVECISAPELPSPPVISQVVNGVHAANTRRNAGLPYCSVRPTVTRRPGEDRVVTICNCLVYVYEHREHIHSAIWSVYQRMWGADSWAERFRTILIILASTYLSHEVLIQF